MTDLLSWRLPRNNLMRRITNNLKLYGEDYYGYIGFLLSGERYSILISKRLLIRPIIPAWLWFLGLFLVRNGIFFGMVVFPCFIIYGVFLYIIYPLWDACCFTPRAYVLFHITMILFLKLLSYPTTLLLEALWTLCF